MALKLIQGAALLLALCWLQNYVARLFQNHQTLQKLASGLLFGLICVIGMMMPITLAPGLIMDVRNIILSLSAVFGGPIVAITGALITGAYRSWIGGIGLNAALFSMTTSILLGLTYRHCIANGKCKINAPTLALFGAIVGATSIACGFLMVPLAAGQMVLGKIALPYILTGILICPLLGLFLKDIQDRLATEQALHQSETHLHSILDAIPDVLFVLDEEGRYTEVLSPTSDLLFNEAAKLVGHYIHDLLPKELADRALHAIQDAITHKSIQTIEYEIDTLSGRRHFEGRIQPRELPHDAKRTVVFLARDITERKNTEKALMLTQFSVEQASLPIVWVTSDGRHHYINDAACASIGHSREEVLSSYVSDFFPAIPKEKWADHWQELKEKKSLNLESTIQTKQGQTLFVEVSSNYLEFEGEEYCCVFIRDITEKKKNEEVIWKQANFDSLTGLPNRRMFTKQLNHEIKHASSTKQTFALLFIDLDNFKDINDTLGHTKGDELLIASANRLKESIRDTDTIARLGGDEFTLILKGDHELPNVEQVCEHILQSFAEYFDVGGEAVYISVSIGVTLFPNDASSLEDLLICADQAMYAAKHKGRNRCHYYSPSMQEEAQKRMQLAKHLRCAAEKDEMFVAYQPIVELSTGNIHKAEALMRWQHTEKGFISPASFIPIAEETGIIHDLGNWIFQEATKQASIWRERHHPEFQVSVNMSPIQFLNSGDKELSWFDFLGRHNFSGSSVAVEITEGVLLDADEHVSTKLLEFRDAGIQVAIDDFGTGYSSLAYLKKFDIDYIKIDRAFVTGLAPESEDLALCEAIIVMAHKLGLNVIAEGVETQEQHDLLLEAGCDFAQGYLFSPPVSAKTFDKLLASH